jgi:hypothetical protein
MATHKHLVDGGQTLDQQENALNEMEQLSFAKVTAYAEVSGTTNNEATLEDVPIGQQPGPLHLEKEDDDTQADNVKVAGKTEIFRGKAFVEGKEKIVLGFR